MVGEQPDGGWPCRGKSVQQFREADAVHALQGLRFRSKPFLAVASSRILA